VQAVGYQATHESVQRSPQAKEEIFAAQPVGSDLDRPRFNNAANWRLTLRRSAETTSSNRHHRPLDPATPPGRGVEVDPSARSTSMRDRTDSSIPATLATGARTGPVWRRLRGAAGVMHSYVPPGPILTVPALARLAVSAHTDPGQKLLLQGFFDPASPGPSGRPARAALGNESRSRPPQVHSTAEGSMKGPRCAECRRRVPEVWLMNRHPVDRKKGLVCSTCYAWLRDPVGPCSECGEEKCLRHLHPLERRKGRVCSTCYGRLTQPMAACSERGFGLHASRSPTSGPEME